MISRTIARMIAMILPVCLLCMGVLTSCRTTSTAGTGKVPKRTMNSLRFIDTFSMPAGTRFQETVVGGLSGIDYVPQKNIYYLVCDDPGAFSMTRFYTAQIQLGPAGIDTVIFVDVNEIRNAAGKPYTDITKDRIHSADLESMRYDPLRDELVRGSEGQRISTPGKKQFQQPDLIMMERDGSFRDSFRLPSYVRIYESAYGLRHNTGFEGLTFRRKYRELLVSIEDALYQDGPGAGLGDSTAWARLLLFNREKRRAVGAYAYKLDAVRTLPIPAGSFRINGIVDVLAVNDDEVLVMERAWSTGELQHHVRIYQTDLKRASDISTHVSLQQQPARRPMEKELLFDFDSLGFYIDNLEGMTWGPALPNGHQTLICVSDDNFMGRQRTQFLLFEVIPGK